MGDAAGIGAEIILKALAEGSLKDKISPLIIGNARFLQKTNDELQFNLPLRVVTAEESNFFSGDSTFPVYDLNNLTENFNIGYDQETTGRASAEYIETAVRLWREGKIDAMATAPISKKAISLGGYAYPGHTEFLAELTGTEKFAMSFFAGQLRVVLLSTHISLTEAISRVKKKSLVELIKFSDAALQKLLNRKVKIAVAGLNPHASEFGLFGSEEAEEIVPAINECRERFGIEVSGAYSPDTIFLRGFRGEFDAVIACYHDQATIAVKSLSFGAAVNVTLGLPLIRTSVDHGTAYDIAGKNAADASSMLAAINLAGELAKIHDSMIL